MALNSGRHPQPGRRPLLTAAWFAIRWGSWLVGHPIGISLFTATALLRLPVGYALVLGFTVDMALTVVGRWWPLPAGVMVRLWRRVRRLTGSPRTSRAAAGRSGVSPRRRTVRGDASERVPGRSGTTGNDRSNRDRAGGLHPLSRAWSIGLWCDSMRQDSERCTHRDGPNSDRSVIELESCDTRHRSRQWAVSVGFGQHLQHPADHDYVINSEFDDRADGRSNGDGRAFLAGRSAGPGNGQWPEGGDRR